MYDRILVPMDGSENAREALRVAARLAAPDAAIHLLNVPELPPAVDPLGRWAGASSLDADRERVEKDACRLLSRERDQAGGTEKGMPLAVRWGGPASAIVEEAKKLGVDAIVMGSRGLSDLRGLAVGSVSHKVMHTAPCRVITVR